ncbi:MAG: DUF58 domain-containing protein [Roseiflexaceae bacterium]
MNRGLLLGLALVLVLLGLATLRGELIALAIPLLVAVGSALIDTPPSLQLQASRQIRPSRANANQPIEIELTITNTGSPLAEVVVREQLPPGLKLVGGQIEQRGALASHASLTLRYQVQGPRGIYHFRQIEAEARDRFGLFPLRATLTSADQVFILPDLIRLRNLAIRPRRTRIYAGQIPARQGGPGVEFFGLRSYQPGDQLRQVNARVSARYEETLFVNEFEQERVADVAIILDARALPDVVGPQGSLFEQSVQAAAALADGLLSQGNRVGLLIYGNAVEWTLAGYGKVQREKILRALASAEVGDRLALESLELIPMRLFPARSLLLIISPLANEDTRALTMLRGRGYQLVVISPDPVDFEARCLAGMPQIELGAQIAQIERAMLLRRLANAGIQVVNWPTETPLSIIAAQALGRRSSLPT